MDMKFTLEMKINDTPAIRLVWDTKLNDDGSINFNESNEMLVLEHDGLSEETIRALKNYMRAMVDAYCANDGDNDDLQSEGTE